MLVFFGDLFLLGNLGLICGRACGGSIPLGPGLIPGMGRIPMGPLIHMGGIGIGGSGLLGPNIGGGGPARFIIGPGGTAMGGGIGGLPRLNIGFIVGGGGSIPRFIPIGGGGGILPNLGGLPMAGGVLGAIGPLFNGLMALLLKCVYQ